MKKKIIIIISIIVSIILIILIYNIYRIKTAKISITYKDELIADFASNVKVSSFIESINGKIIDDYTINTDTLGKKKIRYVYINDDGIKLKQSYELEVKDREAPLVWLGKSYNVTVGSIDNLKSKILCGDNYDENPICEIEGTYNLEEVGSYDLVYKAIDSSGNKLEKKFTLNVNEQRPINKEQNTKKTLFSDVVKDYKTDKTMIGIDVSKWQKDIDFNKLKEAGVEFIIIRIGSSTGINGENFIDSKFIQNITNANNLNIPVGVYFYSHANSKERAISDAKWVLEQIKDYNVELGVALDWENWNSFNEFNLSFFGLTNMANEFLKVINDAGYKTLLYSSKTYLENMWMDIEYPIWLAHYVKNTTYKDDYEYWQICSNGQVEGIDADVDIDIRYLN